MTGTLFHDLHPYNRLSNSRLYACMLGQFPGCRKSSPAHCCHQGIPMKPNLKIANPRSPKYFWLCVHYSYLICHNFRATFHLSMFARFCMRTVELSHVHNECPQRIYICSDAIFCKYTFYYVSRVTNREGHMVIALSYSNQICSIAV